MVYESWGRYPKVNQQIHELHWLTDNPIPAAHGFLLPYGQGRSYGDSCLNDQGIIISTRNLNRFISFDTQNGVLSCEAGVTLSDILRITVPKGWFLPVSPGTKFVSIGGAIANDIHGKNHHRAGSFGRHVLSFELARSDGTRLSCSPSENLAMFRATIGGLGLTGLITQTKIQLKPIASPFIDMESIKYGSLDEFFAISKDSDKDFEYTVAWIDCLAGGSAMGRGLFLRGNHSPRRGDAAELQQASIGERLSVPFEFPAFVLNGATIKVFNTLYYSKQFQKVVRKRIHFDPFFYPLDTIGNWNRIYGRRGMIQFQCVVPAHGDQRGIREILSMVVRSGKASFLAVLKDFGSIPSPGMLSFPREGVTLALDFPFDGQPTKKLMQELDLLVRQCGGAIYPAKDAFMAPQSFSQYYPGLKEFSAYIDPRFSSSFWRRVTNKTERDHA